MGPLLTLPTKVPGLMEASSQRVNHAPALIAALGNGTRPSTLSSPSTRHMPTSVSSEKASTIRHVPGSRGWGCVNRPTDRNKQECAGPWGPGWEHTAAQGNPFPLPYSSMSPTSLHLAWPLT